MHPEISPSLSDGTESGAAIMSASPSILWLSPGWEFRLQTVIAVKIMCLVMAENDNFKNI